MANPLDEVNGPVNDTGREVRVIDKQLPVTVGPGSTVFEIAIWIVGFIPAALVSIARPSDVPTWGYILLWCAGVVPGLIYMWMKVQAKNYFNQLAQKLQNLRSTVENYQEQRGQILQNVAGLVQQAVNLDKDVMTAVAAYRGGTSPDGSNMSENQAALDRGFAALMPHIEAYPELKAHASIAEAMRQNSMLQREITAARDQYNKCVLIWNMEVFRWPVKQIVAARSGFTTIVPFIASKEAKQLASQKFF